MTTRTIRRDLAALQEAGFPLFDEHDDDGRVSWRLDGQLFKGLEAGFTLPSSARCTSAGTCSRRSAPCRSSGT